MGRKAKVAEAIPVPHDGFLHHCLTTTKEDTKNSLNEEALVILTNDPSLPESPTQRLWTTLTTATQNRDQLQALQVYRSHLLQCKGDLLVGTYRILLELSLSYKTNQPMRRAVQACLDTLDGILGNDATSVIQREVVGTLWDPRYWKNPLQTLFEALNYAPTKRIVVEDNQLSNALQILLKTSQSVSDVLELSSFHNKDSDNIPASESTEAAVELTTEIATTAKLLMTHLIQQDNFSFEPHLDVFEQLQLFLWKGIACSTMHADGLSKLGVAYGQTLLITWIQITPKGMSEAAMQRIRQVISDTTLPPLHTLCTVQGIAVVLPDKVLTQGSPVTILEDPIASYLLLQCSQATDGSTRLSSLRSLQTLLTRCSSILKGDENISKECLAYIDRLTQETLQIVMTTWENPPGRQVASAIPGLFNSLVDLIETIHPKEEKAASGIQGLVGRVLAQPVNRKGRYIALETLLPIVGAKALIDSGGNQLIKSLVTGVGDRAHTAGTISALLGKILSKRREEMNQEAGFVVDETTSMNKKQRRKLQQQAAPTSDNAKVDCIKSQLLPEWIALWAPHFARGLLSKSHVRRKQVSAFCIPLLVSIVGGPSRRADASFALSSLLTHLQKEYDGQKVSGTVMPVVSHDAETLDDIFLWAKLEIARQASAQKLLSTVSTTLRQRLKEEFCEEALRSALTHSSPRVRLVAFAAMGAVVPTLDSAQSKFLAAKVEMALWQSALPYAFKSSGKEYTASLLVYLTAFLDRLALAEAEELESPDEACLILPCFSSFLDGFLLDDIIMKQAAYPGTVQEKESFAISLLECVMSFTIGDEFASFNRKSFLMPGQTLRRQRRKSELTTLQFVSEKLMSTEVMAMLLGLCHSIWDATRNDAFRCLTSLTQAAHKKKICLPTQFYHESVVTRGIFLSSSPRQRESDTGAIILAFACSLKAEHLSREKFLIQLVTLLKERIRKMKESLREILSPTYGTASAVTQKGLSLPLAHGLIQSVRLLIEMNDTHQSCRFSKDIIVELVNLCCEAIQVSLSVVADLKVSTAVEGLDSSIVNENEITSAVPLNVNTGAIGANATFSSVKGSRDDAEALRRFATQRVIIGSWLLTREACATLASAIMYEPTHVPEEVIERAGQLLLVTMTALKHQGAAFAAQKSLQSISCHCNSKLTASKLRIFPSAWSDQLLLEISSTEKVRDSTLRRSTGYGLGFLALMRPELSLKVSPRVLCPHILASLVILSLPPKSKIEEHASKLGLTQDVLSLFSSALRSRREGLTFVSKEETTSRVHALNVLRLIILDAPLAPEVAPFIGDCIISSVIGYSDETWAVRNSATMVFSAAMLRVVDADKNAVKKDDTSGSAITAVEFFRQHSPLKTFLLAVLQSGLCGADESGLESSHSPVFLVLLLLARMQPVRNSGNDATAFTDSFVPHVIGSLAHNDHKVRIVAARALANIRSDDPSVESHTDRLFHKCTESIRMTGQGWNDMHGALTGIHEILKTLPNSSRALQCTDASTCVVELCKKEPQVAASCLAVAVEIRSLYMQDSAVSSREIEDLVLFCLGLISAREEQNDHNTTPIVGSATLCTAASMVASEHLSKLLWAQLDDATKYIEDLKRLFVSPNIDTRLIATKIFKKSIYKHIDELLISKSPSAGEKILRIGKITDMLQESLRCEVQRSSQQLGAHPPTVRRISRCLLECLNATRALGSEAVHPEELWALSNLMIGGDSHIDPDDKAMGNAVELMGLSIAASRTNKNDAERVGRFTSLVLKLNDQWGPWRVRHSVVWAVDTSGLLTSENTASHFALQIQVLKLLQDNDPDVRFVAASSMTKQENTGSCAALFALEKAYTSMGKSNRDATLSKYLLASLAEKYKNVKARMEQICDDLTQSENKSDEALLNTDATRKIFEDEDPNSYEEPLLACHMAVVTLANSATTLDDSHNVECSNLMQLATSILKTLQQRDIQRHDVLYDVTRNIILFPDIHGVLLSCIVIIYLGGAPAEHLQEDLRAVVALCGDASSIHPEILEALKVLATARSGDDTTRASLSRLCFLVPNRFD